VLQEIANARKLVATEEFDLLGGTERELSRKQKIDQQAEKEGGILGAQAFQDFVIPSKDPIGVKLLRKMGWRPGQGVGARISAAKRRKLAMEESDQSDEDLDADVTFAPRDSAIIVFAQKRDTFGLGFDPYKNVPDIANVKRARAERASNEAGGKDSGYNKVGFGVGVLDDDDDDDVYDNASNNYTTELYDTGFDEEEHITIGRGRKQASDKSRTKRHKDSRQSSKRVGFDGRVPIPGFEHGTNDILQEKWYAYVLCNVLDSLSVLNMIII
jgi:G patch domain-containing protein 1